MMTGFARVAFLIFVSLALCSHHLFAGTIEGQVTDAADQPVANIEVSAWEWNGQWWNQVSWIYTDDNGLYSLVGLEEGTYRIRFIDWGGNYITETYNNYQGELYDGGADIFVGIDDVFSNINAQLDVASRIEGRVTDTTNQPLYDVEVSAWKWNGQWWNQISWDYTDADGLYSLGSLGEGTYRVRFRDWNGNYITETYDNYQGEPYIGGANILVGAGATVAEINAQLDVASRIEGWVTDAMGQPIEGINVQAMYWDGSSWRWADSDSTDANGYYTLSGLVAREYLVKFDDWNNNQYVSQVYSNHHDSDIWNEGPYDLVSVGTGVIISNIDAVMLEYASLHGGVYREDGVAPVAGCLVVLRDYWSGNYQARAFTDENGQFVFHGITPGSYSLHAGPSDDQYSLSQWLGGVLLVPPVSSSDWYRGDIPAASNAVEVIVSGQSIDGLDVTLPDAGRISGEVKGSGFIRISNAVVRVLGYTNELVFETFTDSDGSYEVRGLYPDSYSVKVEAAAFKDEWWENAHHRSGADMVGIDLGEHVVMDFDLEPGQSPAMVEVTSDPSGASIYLDFYPTTNLTPSVLDVGEVGDLDWAGLYLASHVVALKKDGHPLPAPRGVGAKEAETVSIHFDMTSNTQGGVLIDTIPSGAMVYANMADTVRGVSPITLSELAPGSHTILLGKEGYLQPRPLVVIVEDGVTNSVTIRLDENSSTNRMSMNARSVPHGASVYVNYLLSTNRTEAIIDWMDAASHAGAGWHSASHTIMLKRNGYIPSAPRYVPEEPGVIHRMMMNMTLDPEETVDNDDDGIPDQVAQAYGLDKHPDPAKRGPDGDADGDGVKNMDEILAGTNPMNANDTFESVTAPKPQGQQINFTFNSVPGRSYVVMCSADLKNPAWTYASSVVVATEDQTTVSLTMPQGMECRFFRVVVLAR